MCREQTFKFKSIIYKLVGSDEKETIATDSDFKRK